MRHIFKLTQNQPNRKAWMSIYISLHTFIAHIKFLRIFSLRSHIKQNRNFRSKWSPFGNSFSLFSFLLKQLFRETCLCSEKNMLSHTTIVIINFFSPFFCSHSRDLFKFHSGPIQFFFFERILFLLLLIILFLYLIFHEEIKRQNFALHFRVNLIIGGRRQMRNG